MMRIPSSPGLGRGPVALLALLLVLPSCTSSSGVLVPADTAPPASADATPPAPTDSNSAGVRIVHPGAPGEPSRVVTRQEVGAGSRPVHTAMDVAFMRAMIPHHAQALEMTALVADRTDNTDFLLLARRIEISQRDEIHLMERWLEDRGESLPEAHAHHGHGTLMPGMLTDQEMTRLRNSTGSEFETLFLTFMISHHEGALVMVHELFSHPGAGQDSEIYRFASDVDADQRMEIQRMRAMLQEGR
jgi:uncharacterized protein (DUF305 family)